MGGPGSGRREPTPPRKVRAQAIARLFADGIEERLAQGDESALVVWLGRLDRLLLEGELDTATHRALAWSGAQRRDLCRALQLEHRVKRVEHAAAQIVAARAGGRQLRDVGPPDDDLSPRKLALPEDKK